jgi:hypothetical protein
MKLHAISLVVLIFFGTLAVVFGQTAQAPGRQTTQQKPAPKAFHDSPSQQPLPPILDPEQFRENRSAFVAYTLAAQIEQTLYQVPCYCGCDKEQGHESLLDCFTGKHGSQCRICQKEAIFCFLEQKRHRSPTQIRDAMNKGEVSKLDLERTVKRLYAQMHSDGS